jgi:hypothetical protein
MNRRTPLFITASLLAATLAIVLPDFDLESVLAPPAKAATPREGREPARPADTSESRS